jgi:hypothetical protein
MGWIVDLSGKNEKPVEPARPCAVLLTRTLHRGSAMPAKSQSQQKAAGAALAAKRGDMPKSKLKGASKSMVDSMSEEQLDEMASTKRKGKPEHVSKSKH